MLSLNSFILSLPLIDSATRSSGGRESNHVLQPMGASSRWVDGLSEDEMTQRWELGRLSGRFTRSIRY